MAAAAAARHVSAGRVRAPVLVCIRPSTPAGLGTAPDERIAALLAEAGRDARVATAAEAAEAEPGATLLLRGSARFYDRLLRALGRRTTRPRVVLWHLEPLPLPAAASYGVGLPSLRELAKIALRDDRVTDPRISLRTLIRYVERGVVDGVVATSLAKVETLAEHGIGAAFVPMGSLPLVDCVGERDLGAVFVGDLAVPRRRRALRRLRRAGLDVAAYGDWSPRGLWAAEREHVLCRARIMVNLSRYPGDLAGSRLLLAMRHGALVVSEPMYRPEPYVPGVHYVEATLDEMPAVVHGLLEDEERWGDIVAAGRELCARHSEAYAVTRLLETVDAA